MDENSEKKERVTCYKYVQMIRCASCNVHREFSDFPKFNYRNPVSTKIEENLICQSCENKLPVQKKTVEESVSYASICKKNL